MLRPGQDVSQWARGLPASCKRVSWSLAALSLHQKCLAEPGQPNLQGGGYAWRPATLRWGFMRGNSDCVYAEEEIIFGTPVYFCWQVRDIAAVIVVSCWNVPTGRMETCSPFCKDHVSCRLLCTVRKFPQSYDTPNWKCMVQSKGLMLWLCSKMQCHWFMQCCGECQVL